MSAAATAYRLARPGLPLILAAVLVVATSCGNQQASEPSTGQLPLRDAGSEAAPRPQVAELLPLGQVRFWAYQLQDLAAPGAVDALAASRYDLLVLEPTRTDWSSDEGAFDTRGMVERLQASSAHDGRHRKLVVAYVDIGQAEDWRWYWTWSRDWNCRHSPPEDWPAYILACDPDGWGGNYPVAYWEDAWKKVMIYGLGPAPDRDYGSALDEVLRDGFDGIYLDWVEGYEDEAVVEAAQEAGRDPAAEMVSFMREIRDYAQARHPGFLVIQQNAPSLVDGHPELLEIIDAIAQEAVWYDGEAVDDWNDGDGHDRRQAQDLSAYYLASLARYQQAGLPVLNCEYAVDRAQEAYRRSLDHGLVPYVTRTPLSRLSTTLPPGY